MSVATSKFMNEHRLELEGEIDLSAVAAVTAHRGTGTAAKTAAGTYTVTIPAAIADGLPLVETLKRDVQFAGTVPATATGCRISSVAKNAAGDLVITFKTSASPTTGADTDTTAATSLSYSVVFRTQKMTAQL